MAYINGQKINFPVQVTMAEGGNCDCTEAIAQAKTEAITEAQSYTDAQIAEAKDYADEKSEAAKTEAKTYAGTAVAGAKTYTDQEIVKLRREIPTGAGVPYEVYTTSGEKLRFFVGTKAEYDALESKDSIFAIITDDNTKEELFSRLEALEQGGTTASELNLKIDMPPFFSGQCAFPADKGIYVISFENRTLTLFVPEPVGPGSLQYSTECTNDDGVTYRLKYFNGILYVQKKQDGGDFEQDNDYNEDFRYMKLASAHE